MKKALLSLNEDLASSIALRYVAGQARDLDLALQLFHVVARQGGDAAQLGWVSRSWEKMQLAAGCDEVQRLVRTENIDYPRAGEPLVVMGDRDRETRRELAAGGYSLYAEGYLSSTEPADFHRFLAEARFRRPPCPVLLVKNLVDHGQLLLLLDRETEVLPLLTSLTDLYRAAAVEIELTVLFYRPGTGSELVFHEASRNARLRRAGDLLMEEGWNEPELLAVQGEPARVAAYMQGHGLVAAALPGGTGPTAELLAHLANPVLLFPAGRAHGTRTASGDPE